jgi:hypothetical protein
VTAQLRFTVPEKPCADDKVITSVAELPAEPMVRLVEVGVTDTDIPVPVSATVCGDPVALSVMVRVPLRAPDVVGVKMTAMAQFAPTAMAEPQVFVSLKSPPAAMEVTATATEPELVRVTVCAVLLEPTASAVKVRLAGAKVTVGGGVVAVPLSVTVCGDPVALLAMVTVPAIVPTVVGLKVMLSRQLVFAATETPQALDTA